MAVLEKVCTPAPEGRGITKTDFYELGLTGGPDSAARRDLLLKKLNLPERMTTNALLEAVNILYDKETFLSLASEKIL